LHLLEPARCGLILIFEDGWMLIEEVAAVIRAVRKSRGVGYEDLANVGVQRSISALEQAQVNISVGKLAELANALDFDLVALVALCVTLQTNKQPLEVMACASDALMKFASCGGHKILEEQFNAGKLLKRSRGKPANRENAVAVRALKEQGHTQAEAVRSLGLAKSTVSRYWRD
jgi:transcriptional regulator with XRE-family HTH domain